MNGESQAESQLLRKRVLHPLGSGAGVGDHGADAGWEEAMTVSCPSAINLPKGKEGLGARKVGGALVFSRHQPWVLSTRLLASCCWLDLQSSGRRCSGVRSLSGVSRMT